jgi:uncharacterized repeat protein (TIGR03803 family)
MRKISGRFGAVAMITALMGMMLGASSVPAQAQTYRLLYTFTGGADGSEPAAGLIRDASGNFYGTTGSGGPFGAGTVFLLEQTGKERVLYSFTGPDGSNPVGALVRDAAGDLYGTTEGGGAFGAGVVFKTNDSGFVQVLHSFTGGADGANPVSGLLRDPAGNLYGTTVNGGASNAGTVFKLDPSGAETVLYSFTGGTDGGNPAAGLVQDAAGNLYGTTAEGGDTSCFKPSGCGTIFELDKAGLETVLHSFTGAPDGEFPGAGLVRDTAGNLYGTTTNGGAGTLCVSSCGTVFKLDSTGTETVLYRFTGGADGGNPDAGLVRDAAGNLDGTTIGGGAHNDGTVFELGIAGTETVLYSFTGQRGGSQPRAGLLRDSAGNLYGTTEFGGAFDAGVVFKLTP